MVALAIDIHGHKHLLDFEEGSSESTEVVKGLFARLHARGLKAGTARRLLLVRDGSEAIAKAVRHFWPDAVQQECLVHVERGLCGKLSWKHQGEVVKRMNRLRGMIGKVCRWNPKTDQLTRWMGVALLLAQEGFRRVRGHKELGAQRKSNPSLLGRSSSRITCPSASPLRF